MNFQLTEEQQLIEQSAHDFAKEYLDPIVVHLDETGEFPKGDGQGAGKSRLPGTAPPCRRGRSRSRLCQLRGRYRESFAFVCGGCLDYEQPGNGQLCHSALGQRGAEEAVRAGSRHGRDDWGLRHLRAWPDAGHRTGCLGRDKKRQVATFSKAPRPTCAMPERLACTWCLRVTDPAEPNALTAFLVDAKATGLTVGSKLNTMGLKGCPVAHVVFDNVSVPETAVLGAVKAGREIATNVLALASVAEAAQTVGIGQAAVEHAAAYAKQRVQFGKPVATLQAVQTLLAEAATDCYLARLGLRYAAQLVEDAQPFEAEAAMVKSFLARLGSKILVDSCQVEGGMGYSEAMPLPRLFRDIAGTTLLDAPADFPDYTIAASIA